MLHFTAQGGQVRKCSASPGKVSAASGYRHVYKVHIALNEMQGQYLPAFKIAESLLNYPR